MKVNLKRTLEIGESSSDPKIKLEARRIANDCYRIIMDLCTSSSVLNEALKWVSQQREQIDSLYKQNEKVQLQQSQQLTEDGSTSTKTTNGVF
jgi:hypothetical protein